MHKKLWLICFCFALLIIFSANYGKAGNSPIIYEDEHVYYSFTMGVADTQNSISILKDVVIYSKEENSWFTCSALNIGIVELAYLMMGQLEQIRSFKISAENLIIKESSGDKVSVDNIHLEFEGDLGDMIQTFTTGTDPMYYHTFTFAMDGIKISGLGDEDDYFLSSLVSVINHLSLNLKYYGDLDVVGKLCTPVGNGVLQGTILFEEMEPESSAIKKLQCILSDLSSEVRNAVVELELETGKKLPRRGNDVIIEIKGTLDQLLVKGWDY